MPFTIVLAPEAVEDLGRLKATVRSAVKQALETHLRHEPQKTSRSRIKRLRGLSRPQYRLRVGEVRVFYDVVDVVDGVVEVLAIVSKSETTSWLAQFGKA
jgi:mRNA interferase RelE/StbE